MREWSRRWHAGSRTVLALALLVGLSACDELVVMEEAGLAAQQGSAPPPATTAPPPAGSVAGQAPVAAPPSEPGESETERERGDRPKKSKAEEPSEPAGTPTPEPEAGKGSPRPTAPGDRSGATFEESFEDAEAAIGKHQSSGRWRAGEQPHAHSLELVDNPVTDGRQAARFELRAGDNSPKSDLAGPDFPEDPILPYGEDFWVGFSMMIPSGIDLQSSRGNIMWQIHPKNKATGACGGQPQMALKVENGSNYEMGVQSGDPCGGKSANFDLGPIVRDRYVHFVINFKNSNSAGDYANVWVYDGEGDDSEPKMKHSGPLGYADPGDYSRIGIYAPGCNQGCKAYPWDSMVVYFDEYRQGTSFEAVVPSGAGSATDGAG